MSIFAKNLAMEVTIIGVLIIILVSFVLFKLINSLKNDKSVLQGGTRVDRRAWNRSDPVAKTSNMSAEGMPTLANILAEILPGIEGIPL